MSTVYSILVKYNSKEWYRNHPFSLYPETDYKVFKTKEGIDNYVFSLKQKFHDRAKSLLTKFENGKLKDGYDEEENEYISDSLNDLFFMDDCFYEDYETEEKQLQAIIFNQICSWSAKEVYLNEDSEPIFDLTYCV